MLINLSFSLFRRTGLTKAEVDDIKKELEQTVQKLQGNLDFWKRQFKKQAPTKQCTKCKQPIDVWPFNTTEAYYINGNRATHVQCRKEEI